MAGGFHFDDFINLDLLGRNGRVEDWPSLLRYLTSGTADPTGRPVSMLSFLLDARDWPAEPAPFLRTNLTLHIVNGMLLALLLLQLGRALESSDGTSRPVYASLLGAGLWLLHPLLVSTTLYAVQREAILPASFVLVGLIGYVVARRRIAQGGGHGAWLLLVCSLGLATLLAGFSKANGFLLPLLALVLEFTIFLNDGEAGRWRRRLRIVLLLPSLLLVGVVFAYGLAPSRYAGRDFSLGQRLLTESRILCEYLYELAVPRVMTDGLFNDDIVLSTSLLSPPTTLPALLLIAALPVLAFLLRRRAPAWAAAIGFFLAGHFLESTVLPLELRFEHRNYLPALLLFWPLAWTLFGSGLRPRARLVASVMALLVFALLTWQRATLWGNPDRQTALWLVQHPRSPRALATTAMALRRAGRPELAAQLLVDARRDAPADTQLAFNLASALCEANRFGAKDLAMLAQVLATTRDVPLLTFRWLDDSLGPAPAACRLDHKYVQVLLDAAGRNPRFRAPGLARQNFESLQGRLAIARGDRSAAEAHFRQSLLASVRPEVAAAQAGMLLDASYHAEAMRYLDFYERQPRPTPTLGMPAVHALLLRRQGYWAGLFARMRAVAADGIRK
jgi:hypothetical protein